MTFVFDSELAIGTPPAPSVEAASSAFRERFPPPLSSGCRVPQLSVLQRRSVHQLRLWEVRMASMGCGRCGSKEHATGDCPHEFFSTNCERCGSVDHVASECPRGFFSTECGRCGSKEHSTDDCPHEFFSTRCDRCGSVNHATDVCPHDFLSRKCDRCGSLDHASDDCPQGFFPTRTSDERAQPLSTSDESGCAKVIAALIGVAIAVAVVIWLLANVVLPLALLNSALILTIVAVTVKQRKALFAGLAFVGAGYMLLDVSNGWLSANFVNNVVKTPGWLTAFIYINAFALGVSAWILAQPLLQKATSVKVSDRDRALHSLAAGALTVVPVLMVPIIYHSIRGPFSAEPTTPVATPAVIPTVTTATLSTLAQDRGSDTSQTPTSQLVGIWRRPTQEGIETDYIGIGGSADSKFTIRPMHDANGHFEPTDVPVVVEGKRVGGAFMDVGYSNGHLYATYRYNGIDSDWQERYDMTLQGSDTIACTIVGSQGKVVQVLHREISPDAVGTGIAAVGRHDIGSVRYLTPGSFLERFQDIGTRSLERADVAELSVSELGALRNYIFARHGRPFAKKMYREYFSRFPWYVADPAYSDSRLNSVERQNIALISSRESELGGGGSHQ